MKHWKTAVASAAIWGLFVAAPAAAKQPDISVMTQNQFLGADLEPLLAAAASGNAQALAIALAETLALMTSNDFPVRAIALADQICGRQPHVVGLQEVFRFELNGGSGAPLPLPFVDHLDELMDAIDADCGNYVVAASVQNVDVGQLVPGFGIIGFTDRDVVLVRDDLFFAPVPFSGVACALPTQSGVPGLPASGCHFQAVVPLPPVFGGSVLRGYVGVDTVVNGQPYRVVNTHLEVQRPDGSDFSSVFQALQMAELIGVLSIFPEAPGTRLVVLGDINSSPDDPVIPQPTHPPPFPIPPPFDTSIVPPYAQLVGSGFSDVWNARPGKPPGDTCCHDEDLSSPTAAHGERIDVIFARESLGRSKANVLGGDDGDRILGLWPSDHCTVWGRLVY